MSSVVGDAGGQGAGGERREPWARTDSDGAGWPGGSGPVATGNGANLNITAGTWPEGSDGVRGAMGP